MVNIGEQLLQAENGWKRYNDTNSNITYVGNWRIYNEGSYMGDEKSTTTLNDKIKFNFTGNKIRLISLQSLPNKYQSSAIIKIDNINVGVFNNTGNCIAFQALLFEKTNLTNTEHYVEIINLEQGKYLVFDAIDIDKNGELLPYNENLSKYIIQNGQYIYSINPTLYKVGRESVTEEMFDKYGNRDLANMTNVLNESGILMNKVRVVGLGNEFECQLNSDMLSIKDVEVK